MTLRINQEISNWNAKLTQAGPLDAQFALDEDVAARCSSLASQISTLNDVLNEGEQLAKRVTDVSSKFEIESKITQVKGQVLKAQEFVDSGKKWVGLGLPPSVLTNYPDCAEFLLKSGLAQTLVFFQESSAQPHKQGLKLGEDHHPCLKVEGKWQRWEMIRDEFEYDAKRGKIVSKNQREQVWNYVSPDLPKGGLRPVDRFEYVQVYPVHQLSQEQYEKVVAQALKFYGTHPEWDPGIAKDCVVQFFTSPRQNGLPETPLFKNAKGQFPVHIAIRVITKEGKVYSFGFQMTPEQNEHILPEGKMLTRQQLSTADTKISMLDYEETRIHEGRITTSIPLTSARADNVLEKINGFNEQQIRFNFMKQNCTVLVAEVFNETGYDMPETRTTLGGMIWDALPDAEDIFGAHSVPALIAGSISYICQSMAQIDPAMHVFKQVKPLLENNVALYFGAAKASEPLKAGRAEEEFGKEPAIKSFSRPIRHRTDLFKKETAIIYSSAPFIEWQKQQPSTFIEPYHGKPQMTLYPTDSN